MVHRSPVTLCVAFSLIILSCDKSSVSPGDGSGTQFSLGITVVDTSGRSVSGLAISAWNHITELPVPGPVQPTHSLQRPAAVSTIAFEVPVASHVRLDAFDLDDQLVTTIVDLPTAVTGVHTTALQVQCSGGMRIFKCLLVATDISSGALLYRDSIYAVLWQHDAALCRIGYIDGSGTFQTADATLFPNTMSLPPLTMTTFSPAPLGPMHVSDSVTVVLCDTLTQATQSYVRTITRGSNELRLIWVPGPAPARPPSPRIPPGFDRKARSLQMTGGTLTWKLEQNYPNPFN